MPWATLPMPLLHLHATAKVCLYIFPFVCLIPTGIIQVNHTEQQCNPELDASRQAKNT